MIVIKRDGDRVEYDGTKVLNAVSAAMQEVEGFVDTKCAKEIEATVRRKLKEEGELDVEQIQDICEIGLMQHYPHIAKAYILYRDKKAQERNRISRNKTDDANQLLTDEFISKYKHRESPMGELGSFVYYRTYSRWLPEENRREYWYETVRRAVEYNCSLAPTTREEAEKLYDNIFNLKQFL